MSILTSGGRNLPCSHFWDLNPHPPHIVLLSFLEVPPLTLCYHPISKVVKHHKIFGAGTHLPKPCMALAHLCLHPASVVNPTLNVRVSRPGARRGADFGSQKELSQDAKQL